MSKKMMDRVFDCEMALQRVGSYLAVLERSAEALTELLSVALPSREETNHARDVREGLAWLRRDYEAMTEEVLNALFGKEKGV